MLGRDEGVGEALARGQFALGVLPLPSELASARLGSRVAPAEFFQPGGGHNCIVPASARVLKLETWCK